MIRQIKRILLKLLLLILIAPIMLTLLLKFINPPVWGWQIARTLFPPVGYPAHQKHQWVPISEISTTLPLAVIAAEDQRFTQHSGVDFNAIRKVLEQVSRDGYESLRGASTITQQTAKNVFLFPSHTFVRKAYELYIAMLLELIWGKERIIEVYLNVVEFGPGIYGVEAASQYFFGVPASKVTRHQAAQLAVVLPNPYKMQPTPMSGYVRKRVQWVLKQMRNLGEVEL